MEEVKVVKVYETGSHQYDECQGETVARVLLSNGRRCWIVGYGGDYIPASKGDMDNIEIDQTPDLDAVDKFNGMYVHAYRACC